MDFFGKIIGLVKSGMFLLADADVGELSRKGLDGNYVMGGFVWKNFDEGVLDIFSCDRYGK